MHTVTFKSINVKQFKHYENLLELSIEMIVSGVFSPHRS